MTKEEAFELGKDRGMGIGEIMDLESSDIDNLVSIALEIEQNSRQYSPFEHTAYTFNTAHNPECNCRKGHNDLCDTCYWYQSELWDKFESGITAGITEALSARLED